MRVSTSTLFSANVTYLNDLQVMLQQTNQQIATGQRILDPSFDPVGAARAAELNLSSSTNTQYATNRTAAANTLSLSEGTLDSASSLLASVRATVLSAGSETVSDVSRQSMAVELQNRLNDLIALGNATDGAGTYIFSGSQGSVKPFVTTASGVVYQGDDVQRKIQVGDTRQLPSSDSGADIFMRVRNGNGVFQVGAAATNSGTGVSTQGSVTNASQYNMNSYQVSFTVAAGVTTYSVTDVTSGAPVPVAGMTNVAYSSGQAISFNGVQLEISGAPANGDVFNIAPSSNQSIFKTLSNMIAALKQPYTSASPTAKANFNQVMSDSIAALDQGANSVLFTRATMGARLNEIDSLQTTGDTLSLQFQKTLSSIQDTDYNKALTDFSQEKLVLQAAQQSFTLVAKMSLFNFM